MYDKIIILCFIVFGGNMSVYIEYVLIDNIVMDYIILRLIELTVGIKFNRLNKVFVCIIGSLFALFMPIILDYKIILLLYKILSSIIMVLCIKKYKKLKSFFVYYLMFFAYTFFVGGVCLGVIQLLGIEYTMSSVVMYEFEFSFGVLGVIIVVVLRVMGRVVGAIKSKINSGNFVRNIRLSEGDESVQTYALVDTGNKVNYNGKGVSIISINAFLKLFKGVDIASVLSGRIDGDKVRCLEYINIGGIGVSQKYLSFIIDYIEIDGKRYNSPRLALSWKDIGEYDVVLHSEFMGGFYEKINNEN